MRSYPTDSPSRNRPAVASTGNRWTAILQSISQVCRRITAKHGNHPLSPFPTTNSSKEQLFLLGLKAEYLMHGRPLEQVPLGAARGPAESRRQAPAHAPHHV